MSVEIRGDEQTVVKHALEVYLSNLRGEIVKTEKSSWKKELHMEEDTLKGVISRFPKTTH